MGHWKTTLLVLALLVLAMAGLAPAATAGDFLRESGVSGGVAVHVGCGAGRRTAALHADDKLLVHGLDTDPAAVAEAKAHIDSLGLYGRVSAERYDGKNLPHGDNIVNLIVIEDPGKLTAKEVIRVLAPNGVAMVKGDALKLAGAGLGKAAGPAGWSKYTKPWPREIDEWTHFLYDASGSATSRDRKVGHPRHVQWYAGPRHTRHHDSLSSFSAMTSGGGRVFYIYDEGEVSVIHRPPHWKLIARDAFNGKLLWKREIPTWMTHLYNFRAGPKQLPRRLVSVGKEVFVTLGFTAPVTKLDAATGKTLMTYAGSAKTEEIIRHKDMLLVVTGDPNMLMDRADGCHGYWELAEDETPTAAKSIIAYDAGTGRQLWKATGEDLKHLTPQSLSAKGDNVFYLDNENLHCLDAKTGRERWKSPFATKGLFIRSYAPTVTVGDDVIVVLVYNRMCGYAIKDGRKVWENKGAIGFGAPGDLFLIGDTLWTEPLARSIWRESKRNSDGYITTGIAIPRTSFLNEAKTSVGVNIRTGKITHTVPFAHNQHHHRCYRDKATGRYLLIGYSGIQLLDLKTGQSATNKWVRGVCQYGIMPANGLLYVPPDPCQCYADIRLNGFFTLGERSSTEDVKTAPAIETGPAREAARQAKKPTPAPGDWPTYRGDIARSGSAGCEMPDKLTIKWQADVGEGITAPVVVGERVYVARKQSYSVHCLDRATGEEVWKFLANGPVDSPPTIHGELCVFGCGDGSVYCLSADTGKLAWRFKVSAIERRIGSEDRLESPLAISGSVLVLDDVVYFAAGRSSFLDGGIRLYGLDVRTGRQLYEKVVASGYWDKTVPFPAEPKPKGKSKGKAATKAKKIAGALSDILISNGKSIAMRHVQLSKTLSEPAVGEVLSSSKGLLDGSWFHRQPWKLGGETGQLIVHGDSATYSVINPYTTLKRDRKGMYKQYNQVGHYHQKFTRYEKSFFPVGVTISAKSAARRREPAGASWSISEPFQPRAMVLAGQKLLLAGWLDAVAVELKTGRPLSKENPDPHDAVLRVYSTKTGKRLSEYKLPCQPTFDGIAAARGQLFISMKNGKIVCMGQ